MREKGLRVVLLAALLLWAWVCVPTLLGRRTFFLRDVFITHVPLKAFGAEQLQAGRIPAFNPTWGLGQPFRGNPNALPFYPGNLVYLALPFWSAFNLHYALHWLLALAAMAALARGLGQGRAAALMAGLTYAGCGWMLSALTFYNVLAVAAWWPLALLGAARGGRSGIALGGLACGLALLGGEPVTAALGLAPLLLAAVSRHGWKRGLGTALAIGGAGLLIALPQVVATLRVLPFTLRGGQGVTAAQAATFALHPLRLLELLIPFPFGWPTYIGRHGIWARSVLLEVPLFFTLYAGTIGLWLAGLAARRRRAWALLAAAGLVLAIVAASWGELLVRASFGLFRYPEKLLFWPALALPLLAGWGLERAVAERPKAWRRTAIAGGGLALVLAAALALARPAALSAASARLPPDQRQAAADMLSAQMSLWASSLAVAGAALLAALPALGGAERRPWSPALLCALQLATLAQLHPLALTDSTRPYREPSPWARRLGRGAAAANSSLVVPPWDEGPRYRLPEGPRAVVQRINALGLDPSPGVLHGLTYPLAPNLEGMHSPLFHPMLRSLPGLDWRRRVRWFRSLGLDAIALFEEPGVPGLRLLDRAERYGARTYLYEVAGPAPRAWWPRRLAPASDPEAAMRSVSGTPDPVATVAAPPTFPGAAHDPAGRVRVVAFEPDRIEIEVESRGGGVAVVRRAFQPLFLARSEGRRLPTLPANLNLLGVAVPPGRHRVALEVSAWPEILAGIVALLSLTAALSTVWRDRMSFHLREDP